MDEQPLPREAVATSARIQDFAGKYRLAADAATTLGFLEFAERRAGDTLVLQVAGTGLDARYVFADGRVEVGVVEPHPGGGLAEGRLRYGRSRHTGAVILPGLGWSDEGAELYLDEKGDLVVIQFCWERGLLLFLLPFYESRRSVTGFHRIDG